MKIDFEFNYASITMVPYAQRSGTATQLLKDIIRKIHDPDFPADDKVKNRTENQKRVAKRELALLPGRFESGLRYYGRIALIKNKLPMKWNRKDIVEEVEKEENQDFIEVTNFSINFNENSEPIIMHEFNNEGPRLSDIIWYLRQISKDYRLGKNIRHSLHLKCKFDELDKELSNVFNITVKVATGNNHKLNWWKVLKTLQESSGYRDVRLELFYNRAKEKDGTYKKNIRGIDLAREFIGWLKKDKDNIECVDDLKMTYQTNDSDDIIELDFLKNKVISNLSVPCSINLKYKKSDLISVVRDEFNMYLRTGQTTISEPK